MLVKRERLMSHSWRAHWAPVYAGIAVSQVSAKSVPEPYEPQRLISLLKMTEHSFGIMPMRIQVQSLGIVRQISYVLLIGAYLGSIASMTRSGEARPRAVLAGPSRGGAECNRA